VSCSPFRVPVARLAAAQAAIADAKKAATKTAGKPAAKGNGKVAKRLLKPVKAAKKLVSKRR
jgi:pyruvate,orthophosphate dikinase